MDPMSLPEAIQSLPQELQDNILAFTLIGSFESSHAVWPPVVKVDDAYRVPWQLAVNRVSRRKVAKKYYSMTAFDARLNFRDASNFGMFLQTMKKWLGVLPDSHLQQIQELRIDPQLETELPTESIPCLEAFMLSMARLRGSTRILEALHAHLGRAQLKIAPDSIKAKWTTWDEDEGRVVESWLSPAELEDIASEVTDTIVKWARAQVQELEQGQNQ